MVILGNMTVVVINFHGGFYVRVKTGRRKFIESLWNSFIKKFYNISGTDYSAHHLLKYSDYPDHRTSITNGFPVKKEIHSASFIENSTSCKNPLHTVYKEISYFPSLLKLEYHSYKNFRFLNLSSKVVTEIIVSSTEKDLLHKKFKYAKKGILYIPIYFEELFVDYKREIVFSTIKNYLYKYYSCIYEYTGTICAKYYARDLTFFSVREKVVEDFLNSNDIKGFIKGKFYFGLFTEKGKLVQVLVLSKSNNRKYSYELSRLTVLNNTAVIGGEEKLFKNMLFRVKPVSLIAYSDLRFSTINYKYNNFYKLGFTYLGRTKQNLRFTDRLMHFSYSRMKFIKNRIESGSTKLENIPGRKVIQFDCGSNIFVYYNK